MHGSRHARQARNASEVLETAGGQCRLNSRIENVGSDGGYKPAGKPGGDKRKGKDFTPNVSLACSRQTLHAYRQWPVYDEGGAGDHRAKSCSSSSARLSSAIVRPWVRIAVVRASSHEA